MGGDGTPTGGDGTAMGGDGTTMGGDGTLQRAGMEPRPYDSNFQLPASSL